MGVVVIRRIDVGGIVRSDRQRLARPTFAVSEKFCRNAEPLLDLPRAGAVVDVVDGDGESV